jgi:hypothetical protein
VDPVRPIEDIAYWLTEKVVIESDDASEESISLEPGTAMVILDLYNYGSVYQSLVDTGRESVYKALLAMGYTKTVLDQWILHFEAQLLTLSVEDSVHLIVRHASN